MLSELLLHVRDSLSSLGLNSLLPFSLILKLVHSILIALFSEFLLLLNSLHLSKTGKFLPFLKDVVLELPVVILDLGRSGG